MSVEHTLVVSEATTVGDRFRVARIAAGLTPNEAARLLGVSQRTYERIESDVREPRRGEIVAFAQITGQDVAFFGGGSSVDCEARVLPDPLPGVNDVVAAGDAL